MKKLFFASIVMLATLTACNSGESMNTTHDEQQHQTFQSKTEARDGEELPPLTPEEEKAKLQEAIKIVNTEREAAIKHSERPAQPTQILCHTDYSSANGHACVWSNGYLVEVTWSPEYTPDHGLGGTPIPGTVQYSGQVTPRCSC